MGKTSSQKKKKSAILLKLVVKNLNKTNLLLLYFVSLCLFEAIWACFAILCFFFFNKEIVSLYWRVKTGSQNQPKSPQIDTRTQNIAKVSLFYSSS